MKKIDINKVPVTTFILFIICVIVTAALAGTNYITKSRIAALEEKAQQEAMVAILPADNYSENTIEFNSQPYTYYKAQKDGEIAGYLISTAANGYGGEIKIMVGTDTKGTVTGIKIVSADDETPGLGANIKNKSFYEQYSGKVKGIILKKNQADSSKNEVKAVTSATISSTAVNKAVNKALDVIDSIIVAEQTADTEKEGE